MSWDPSPRILERRLVLSYAPASARAGLAALLALDEALGAVLRTTREPILGQMRLAWWRDRLIALDQGPAPREPVLTAVARSVAASGVTGSDLAAMVEGWEALLLGTDDDALDRFGAARGGGLFAAGATLLGDAGYVPLRAAGEGWALADVGGHLSDADAAGRARKMAASRLAAVRGGWPRSLRPLGALALMARADLDGVPPASPRRVGRMLLHRLTGR